MVHLRRGTAPLQSTLAGRAPRSLRHLPVLPNRRTRTEMGDEMVAEDAAGPEDAEEVEDEATAELKIRAASLLTLLSPPGVLRSWPQSREVSRGCVVVGFITITAGPPASVALGRCLRASCRRSVAWLCRPLDQSEAGRTREGAPSLTRRGTRGARLVTLRCRGLTLRRPGGRIGLPVRQRIALERRRAAMLSRRVRSLPEPSPPPRGHRTLPRPWEPARRRTSPRRILIPSRILKRIPSPRRILR